MRDRLSHRPDRNWPPKAPLWWKAWFAFCAAAGLTVLGVGLWAVIRLVNHYT